MCVCVYIFACIFIHKGVFGIDMFIFEELYILGCNALKSGESQPVFWRNISPPFLHLNGNSLLPVSCCFLFGLFFSPEGEGDMYLHNVC
jgi:hypothetical protein